MRMATSLACIPAGVAEADSVVVLMDGQAGLQPGDREIISWLRSTHPSKPIILGINKCENSQKADLYVADFWELGLTPLPVSAMSGTGTGELLDALMETLPAPKSLEQEDAAVKPLAIAIVGRPNVGKCSIEEAHVHAHNTCIATAQTSVCGQKITECLPSGRLVEIDY